MKHNSFSLWAATVLLTLTTACTETEVLQTNMLLDNNEPHTYRLSIDMPMPSHDGQSTRAATEWEDGSKVDFKFYTNVVENPQAIYNSVSGVATYSAETEEWLLENMTFPSDRTMTDCEVRYYQLQAGSSDDFLTAVYYGTTTYSIDGDQILCDSISLKPTNWRLRFQGKEGDQMVLTSEDLRHSTGTSLYAGDSSVALGSLSLTVTSNGYTPYIYGTFKNEDGDNTITVESGGQKYTRTISGTALKPGETGYIVVPTESNYMSEGWTQIKEKYTSADATPLNFGTAADSQYFTVDSNEEWTVTSSDPSWCTVEQNFSSNTVKVTVTENTSTSERNATITITGKESGDVTEVTVTQNGVAPHTTATPVTLTFMADAADSPQNITVTSNEEWTATSNATSWCTVSPAFGSDNGTVTVTVTENTTTNQRTATITITGKESGDETKVTVTQKGKSVSDIDINPFGDDENWD